MKYATISGFGGMEEERYKCQYEWDKDCSCQCGDVGVVFSKKGNYRTAFFEAFPAEMSDYIRGEGKDIREAEEDAWKKYRKIADCPGHEYERRTHTDGSGYCKLCNDFKTDAFLPTTTCVICDEPTNWTSDIHGNSYCEKHKECIPEENKRPKISHENLLGMLFGC